jgi:hypothetical protein
MFVAKDTASEVMSAKLQDFSVVNARFPSPSTLEFQEKIVSTYSGEYEQERDYL